MTIKERAFNAAMQNKRTLINQREKELDKKLSKIFSIKEISQAQQELTLARFSNFDDSQSTLVKEKLMKLDATLKKHGYSFKDILPPEHICTNCNDTGIVDGKICTCILQDYKNALFKESGLVNYFTIQDVVFNIVADDKTKELLEKYYTQMLILANRYPIVKKNTFLYLGKTGTGKTYLAQATAGEFIKKEHSVKFVNAYKFNSDMIAAHISPISQKDLALEDYLTSDLLVIDDLGTEPITRNVTLEYLYLVLSQRQEENKSTIITTNLDGNGIMSRYQERIFSRLTSKAFSLIYNFTGSDLRLK